MSTEERLRELILKRYNSVREFTIEHDIPYTTMHSIFKRGIDNSSMTNIIKICKALHISVDALADEEIKPLRKQSDFQPHEGVEVEDILNGTKDYIIHTDKITLDGKPISKAVIESLVDSIDIGVEIAKKKVWVC